jgi:hypothetical protein
MKSIYKTLKPYPNYHPGTHFECADIKYINLWEKYLYSMYASLSLMTTVAYGNVIPIAPPEIVFTLVLMISGTVIFAYIIGEILVLV